MLVVAHGHPEFIKGGAENAAFNLFNALRSRNLEAWFLGCDTSAGQRDYPSITQPLSDREYLYSPTEFNWFNFANRDPRFARDFRKLLITLAPNIVHFHHFARVGVEAFNLVKRVVPNAVVFLTLHEYLAICHHSGQMVTRPDFRLCGRASDARCAACFPEIEASDFFLRRRYILGFFESIDHLIAPSRFLADRYRQWGIAGERVSVLPNVVSDSFAITTRLPAPTTLLIGFFGQISQLKGIDVLLDAAEVLANAGCTSIGFAIFGDYSAQPEAFRNYIRNRLSNPGPNVRFHGPYDQNEIDVLMSMVDAVLVPSIWWENSPLVIDEALRRRRPVICSDIGGMAEMVRDGVDGLHFRVGSATALADLLRRVAADRAILDAIGSSMRTPPPTSAVLDAHLTLYETYLAETVRVEDNGG